MTNKPSLMPASNVAPMSGANGSGPIPSSASGGSGGGGGGGGGSGPKMENSTMRITSKTKVSTGSRRNHISECVNFFISIP